MLPPCVALKSARFAAEKYSNALRRSDLDVRESHPRGASLYARRANYSSVPKSTARCIRAAEKTRGTCATRLSSVDGARVLLADDHEGVRAAVSRLIRRSSDDWDVCGEACNGHSAVEKAIALKPELVILDRLTPQLDGISAAQKIRAVLPETPIVLATLFPSAAVAAPARQSGIQAVVQKSDAHDLIPAIRRALENVTVNSSLDDHDSANPP